MNHTTIYRKKITQRYLCGSLGNVITRHEAVRAGRVLCGWNIMEYIYMMSSEIEIHRSRLIENR